MSLAQGFDHFRPFAAGRSMGVDDRAERGGDE